jgi:hypothetical protein
MKQPHTPMLSCKHVSMPICHHGTHGEILSRIIKYREYLNIVGMFLYTLEPRDRDELNLKLPPCYHISLPYTMGFDLKVIHQRNQTTCLHATHCHHCHYSHFFSMLTLCYSILSHTTLVFYYHASMLTLHTSLISRALWLAQAWYWGG